MADIGDKPVTNKALIEKRKQVEIMQLQTRVAQLELRKIELQDQIIKVEEEKIGVSNALTQLQKGGNS